MEHEDAVGTVVGDSGARKVVETEGDAEYFKLHHGEETTITSHSRIIMMPSPTEEQQASPLFKAIWSVIKSWDVNVPEFYDGYCGANGSHVLFIMNSINQTAEPCCEKHDKLRPSYGGCGHALFDGCDPCCWNCPDLRESELNEGPEDGI